MMRSMYSAITGLKVHQTEMDVIANNISNVNTIAFKSSRVTFSEFMSQNLSGASGANATTGRAGTNPMQIGLGVALGSIDIDMSTGSSQRTDKPFDLMINGDGFFIVSDASGQYFTRAGNIQVDVAGNVSLQSGQMLMGWDAFPDYNNPGQFTITKDTLQPIKITGDKTYILPETTKNISISGNLNPIEEPEVYSTLDFYDSLGNRYVIDTKMEYHPPGSTTGAEYHWGLSLGNLAYINGDNSNPMEVEIDADGTITFVAAATNAPQTFTKLDGEFKFNNLGQVDTTILTNYTVTIDPSTDVLPVDAIFGDINSKIVMDLSGLTGLANSSGTTLSFTGLDGYEAGALRALSVGADGSIIGDYGNGLTKILYQIPVAQFANPAGLEKQGSNLFTKTVNSGEFDSVDVSLTGGSILGGALEMSNVDLSTEFIEMITTQRGFQANSRIISTSDEILQELVNLKR